MTEQAFWKALDERIANVEQKSVRRHDAEQTHIRVTLSDAGNASKSLAVLRQSASHLVAARAELNDYVRDSLISSARGLLVIHPLPSRSAPTESESLAGTSLSGREVRREQSPL